MVLWCRRWHLLDFVRALFVILVTFGDVFNVLHVIKKPLKHKAFGVDVFETPQAYPDHRTKPMVAYKLCLQDMLELVVLLLLIQLELLRRQNECSGEAPEAV